MDTVISSFIFLQLILILVTSSCNVSALNTDIYYLTCEGKTNNWYVPSETCCNYRRIVNGKLVFYRNGDCTGGIKTSTCGTNDTQYLLGDKIPYTPSRLYLRRYYKHDCSDSEAKSCEPYYPEGNHAVGLL